MAPHSSTLAWKIPWTEEPGRLQSMGSPRVRHDWSTSLLLFTFMHWRRKWQPTPVFLPGESQGRVVGALWAAVSGVAQSRTRLKQLSSSSSNEWCWASFHVFVSHLHVFFGEMSVYVFFPLLIGLFVFLVLSCMSCLYVMEINPLSSCFICYYIFSHSEGCLFTSLIASFAMQKLWSLIRSHLFTFVFISITLFLPGKSHGWRSLVGCSP